MTRKRVPIKLNLGQVYILACCVDRERDARERHPRDPEMHSASVYMRPIDGPPTYAEVVLDGKPRRISQHARGISPTNQHANGLAKRGLLKEGPPGGVFHLTEAGRRALEEREDLVRELVRLTEAHEAELVRQREEHES